MMNAVLTAPPYSVIFIVEQALGEIPVATGDDAVASTPTCIAVGTFPVQKGDTRISLSDEAPYAIDGTMMFDGILATPKRQISICSALGQRLLRLDVLGESTRVQVWGNHPSQPDTIDVVVQNDHPNSE
jgi:hypothetical protein